ncbi:MAG: serine hydrolase domain-containing protein [Propionibacteriaceae bacterium]
MSSVGRVNSYTLPTSSPEAQGVDPRAIKALIEAWEASGIRPFALRIIRHGHLVASLTWAPYQPDDNVLKYSLSKTFTASAVGMAVADGLLDIDAPVVSYFPEITGVGPVAQRITLRNVLSMASGHTEDTIEKLDPADPIGSFLRLEPDQEPGSVFCYNQGCTLTQSALVQRVTGQPLHDYLRPRLFDPLGIGPIEWLTLGEYDQGFSGLHITADAVARLGLTILNGGVYGDTRLLRQEWTDEAMTVQVDNPGDNVDWSQGYGFQMWHSRHGWRGDGAFGQLCLVMREEDLVVAACAQVDDMQLELDLVWQHLLPGLYDQALPETEDLTAFLADRELPTVASTTEGTPGTYELTATGSAAAMVTASGFVVLDGTTLTFDDGTGPVAVPLGDGTWERIATTMPDGSIVHTAGTGGWTEPGILTAKIVPLHSPHVLLVRVDTIAGTVVLDWQTQPLGTVSLARRALRARSFG